MIEVKKKITFIYMDKVEYGIYESIAEEAKRRGYEVKFSDDKFEKCEIGFYCQHVNFPQFSKFSVIMLHDITQQYGKWPDLWLREPWNIYNIGFLPNKQWIENWNKCSQWFYARPQLGMYQIGWPKADKFAGIDRDSYRIEFNKAHNLSNKKRTILYAPAWENDDKEDEFVKAMCELDVNILIKQYPADPKTFPYLASEIERMYILHKDNPRVTILDPKSNIFEAILACDVLVSEESSTMCEAVMMGIPAVSVSDWLIPDTSPKRYPACNYSFVFMTKKEELTEFISHIIHNYDETKRKVEKYREETFGEIGQSAKKIMDIVDDCINGKEVRYKAVPSNPNKCVPLKQILFYHKTRIIIALRDNYAKRNPWFGKIYGFLRFIKHGLKNN